MVAIITWKSDSPVSIVVVFVSLVISLVTIKSMQVGLSDLKHAGFLTTFSKLQLFMKSFKFECCV